MRMRLGELRRILNEVSRHAGFHDRFFIEDIVPMLKKRGLLPAAIGNVVGYGNEAVVFTFGSDKVIRLHPTYELFPDQAEEVFVRMKNAPSGGLYARVFDVGYIKGYDEDRGEDVSFAVYATMERLTPLTDEDANIIDAVVTRRSSIDDVEPGRLRDFLQKYVQLSVDHDSKNVMKRGDEYVIIDPE